jgi:hypothetical protein
MLVHGLMFTSRQSVRASAGVILLSALIYGAAMGSSGEILFSRPLQVLYSAIKLPLLMAMVFAISLPSFFVINTVVGVRADFTRVLRALIASQAALTITLCSFSPLTLFSYLCTDDHELHILFNAIVFLIASLAGDFVLRQHYTPLIARTPIHARLMKLWLIIYAFVGIQAAWVLRPFVGDPTRATQFLRDDPWTNAYVWLARMIGRVIFSTTN